MIERETNDGIVTLRLAHGKANALDVEFLEALTRELNDAADARAVIVTAGGSIFSAGVDLFRLTEGGEAYVRRFFPLLTGCIRALIAFPAPLVVAANGHSIAGGGILIMAGDYRLLADGNGRVGVPELVVGVPFPSAALELVRFAVGPDRINPLVFLGRTYAPQEALARGLVDEVVSADALAARAHEAAEQLAAISPRAFRLSKRMLRAPVLERIDRSAADDEEVLAAWLAPETHAKIREYLAKTVRK